MRGLTMILSAIVGLWLGQMASAQNAFSPAIRVNDAVITNYEIDQRIRLLRVLNTAGDLSEQAREGLIDDRLRVQEMQRVGLELTPEALRTGLEEFAGRANLTVEQLEQALLQQGIEISALRDLVAAGLGWREYVSQRFGPQAQISESDVDQALAGSGGGASGIRVLLSEIIMVIPPGQEAVVEARAQEISQLTSTDAFSSYARRFSALPTRGAGGQVPWRMLNELPPAIQPLVLTLQPGEVTAPLPLQGAVALFQLRAIEETDAPTPDYAAIEYATLLLPGGRSEATLRRATEIAARADTCDDLYGLARDLPPEQLRIDALPPAQVPQDIGIELMKLDAGETSLALTRNGGEALMLVMLCGRTPSLEDGDGNVDRDAVRNRLRARRLNGYADALLAELRADATIRLVE